MLTDSPNVINYFRSTDASHPRHLLTQTSHDLKIIKHLLATSRIRAAAAFVIVETRTWAGTAGCENSFSERIFNAARLFIAR